ncbi:type II toxin-antitoxin system PemK/MazF family toxin [Deinococcus sp.]|uniref:type II toxin-antitoxin system PemK/MazF family toxin n=1 Tax=Deinococcus sp. TaxID=47478 RepID=UPI003B5AC38D
MVIERGDIWWADFGEPIGSRPAYLRPVVIVQDDSYNRSRLNTVIVAILTGNQDLASAPGNVRLEPFQTGLKKSSVVNITSLQAINKVELLEYVSTLSPIDLKAIENGLRRVLGLF